MPRLSVAAPPHWEFAELEIVALRSVAYTEEGSLPVGSRGTVVYKYDADAYEVEFIEPVAALLTLRAADIELAE